MPSVSQNKLQQDTDGSGQPNQFNTNWTVERLDLLRLRWAANRSQAEIAAELGVTRNAVAGKISRLGLKHSPTLQKPRAPRVRPPSPVRTTPMRKPPPIAASALPPEEPFDGAGISLVDLTNTTCRWPHGDEVILFCGAEGTDCNGGRPYCAAHTRMAKRA